VDPFIWQIDNGSLSLRGAGYQVWIGAPTFSSTETAADEEFTVDLPPTLSNLSVRAEEARLTISDIGVSDTDGITVRFTSPGQGDVATSDLVERVTETVGNSVRVNEVVALVDGKRVPVDYNKGVAGPRTSSRVSVSGLIWNGWNLLAETNAEVRETLAQILNHNGEQGSDEGAGDAATDREHALLAAPVTDEGSESL
jgi:hypothetical protein